MIEYLKEHIIEELDGAEDYWEKALENKGNNHSHIFQRMAEMELEHANALTKMLNQIKDNPEDHSAAYKEILEAYTDKMGKVEAIKKLYYK